MRKRASPLEELLARMTGKDLQASLRDGTFHL